MKQHIKLYEEYKHKPQFFTTYEEVSNFVKMIDLNQTFVKINSDLTVDYSADVYIDSGILGNALRLPIKFGNVDGSFYLRTKSLVTLYGCPDSVSGMFICKDNKNLKSLEGIPQHVGGSIDVRFNSLTSLVFAPKEPENYSTNPCTEIYRKLGWTIDAHAEALKTLDPYYLETIERLEMYNPRLSRELRIALGMEGEELQNVYNKVKDIEKGYF